MIRFQAPDDDLEIPEILKRKEGKSMNAPAVIDRDGLPAMIQRAANTLSSATTAAEILEARDVASVAYDAAKRAARLATAKGAFDEVLAKITRAQADALDIEARAKRRLADEYDAAQERGEVRTQADNQASSKLEKAGSTELNIKHRDIHEARIIRDAEEADPGVVRRTIDEAVASGEEPTRAKVRRAVLRTVKPKPAKVKADHDAAPAKPARGMKATCTRAREAISTLAGMPPPESVVAFLRNTDEALLIDDHLASAARWLDEFDHLWRSTHVEAAE